MTDVVDLFAGGGGGWDRAARELGIDPLGIELDAAACATRRVAGLRTWQADVAALDPADFAPVTGLIASAPCPTWSRGGKRDGVADQQTVIDVAAALAEGRDIRADVEVRDPRSLLVVEPLRWALELRPEWIALEQVPDVFPFWRALGGHLERAGYGIWTGILNAADYGVPQTRERAILIATLERDVDAPDPTHADPRRGLSMLAQPWASMADVCGWAHDDLVGFPRRNDKNDGAAYRERDRRPASRPAFALTEKARSWTRLRASDSEAVPVTVDEAAQLQTFPPGVQWQGSRTAAFLQIANAIPPTLARPLLAEVLDRALAA